MAGMFDQVHIARQQTRWLNVSLMQRESLLGCLLVAELSWTGHMMEGTSKVGGVMVDYSSKRVLCSK